MATLAAVTERPEAPVSKDAEPPLEMGDRVSRAEFERRYEQMPYVKKAELIEGTVYMPSPVRAQSHAEPHSLASTWLGVYVSETPAVKCFDNSTVRLDLDNEPQPDLALIQLPPREAQARISKDDYIEGAPELVVEVVASSRSYDLHQKKDAYRRNGVQEYLAWIISERRLVWWELREGRYEEIAPDAQGLIKSRVFPGLWLDAKALLSGDMRAVLVALRHGLDSPEQAAFIREQRPGEP
jgi:Uma2 family endonuclease